MDLGFSLLVAAHCFAEYYEERYCIGFLHSYVESRRYSTDKCVGLERFVYDAKHFRLVQLLSRL